MNHSPTSLVKHVLWLGDIEQKHKKIEELQESKSSGYNFNPGIVFI